MATRKTVEVEEQEQEASLESLSPELKRIVQEEVKKALAAYAAAQAEARNEANIPESWEDLTTDQQKSLLIHRKKVVAQSSEFFRWMQLKNDLREAGRLDKLPPAPTFDSLGHMVDGTGAPESYEPTILKESTLSPREEHLQAMYERMKRVHDITGKRERLLDAALADII